MLPRQFTIVSLLVATSLVAVLVALCIPDREWAAEQRALRMMAEKGATVRIYTTGVQVDFTGKEPPNREFTSCGGELLRTLTPSGKASDFGDQDFHLFRNVRRLWQLNLQGTNLTFDSIVELRRTRAACEITL